MFTKDTTWIAVIGGERNVELVNSAPGRKQTHSMLNHMFDERPFIAREPTFAKCVYQKHPSMYLLDSKDEKQAGSHTADVD